MTSSTKNPFPQSVPKPPRRLSPESISAKAEEIATIVTRLDRAGADLDAAITEISVDLTDVAKGRRETELRAAFAGTVAPLLAALAALRDDLAPQAPYFGRDAVRSRATFGESVDALQSAQLGSFWLARIARASVGDLREIAREAAGRSDLALCLAVENEVGHRVLVGDQADEIIGIVASVPVPPQDAAALQRIGSAWGAAEQARLTVDERSTGVSRSVERMNAAFAAAALVGRPSMPVPAHAPAVEVADLVPAS